MNKKESRQFNISVEGINCEKMYFEHLARLINNSNFNTYNLKISPRKMTPLEYAKRNAHKPHEKKKSGQSIPFIHIQDIEDFYDESQRTKFFGIIDEMRTAEETFHITYRLGYSNYTFELWMLLHVADMNHAVPNRKSYLPLINRWFARNYSDIDEFKHEKEFQQILDEYVSLNSVKQAINRAQQIVSLNAETGKTKENYKNVSFYQDNPDVSVHEIVQMIFDVCKVI